MAYTLGNKCVKNLYKRTILLQLIIENVVTCFFLEHSVVQLIVEDVVTCFYWYTVVLLCAVNPLEFRGTSNNIKLVHWPLMGWPLHLVQRGGACVGCGPSQSPPRCTKCNSTPINGQCTNHALYCYMMVCCSAVSTWRLKG